MFIIAVSVSCHHFSQPWLPYSNRFMLLSRLMRIQHCVNSTFVVVLRSTSVHVATSCCLTQWSMCLFCLVKCKFCLWTSHPNSLKSSGHLVKTSRIWISWLVKQMCADLHQSNEWQSGLSQGFFNKSWVLFVMKEENGYSLEKLISREFYYSKGKLRSFQCKITLF